MRRSQHLPVFILGVLLISTALSSGAGAGEEIIKDDVLHVVNSAAPGSGHETVVLDEVWRVGGEDSEDFFGMISQVVAGDDGTIYLLDTRLSEVPVYSAAGERIDTLSREGEGPGETRIPSNLLFMPDGSLGLVQVFPGKIIKIEVDGTPAGNFELGSADPTEGGFMQLFDCITSGDNLVVTGEMIKQAGPGAQNRTNFVAAYDMEGNEKIRFWENTRHLDFTKFEFIEDERNQVDFRKMAVGRDGRLYVAAERNEYAINVYDAAGNLERIFERTYEHRLRTDEEIERMRRGLEAQLQQLPDPVIKISRTEPDISGLRCGPDGNLWIETSRGGFEQPEGILYTWDLFTPDGHFVKQVSAACPGDGENDILIWTPDGDAVQVTGFVEALESLQGGGGPAEEASEDDTAPMEVIYYRVASRESE